MKLSSDAAQEYRFELILKLREEGFTQKSISTLAQCSQGWVSKVLHRAQSDNLTPLKVRHAPGSASRLSSPQLMRLKDLLIEGALQHDFETDNWTRERIAALILREFKVAYHISHMSKLLRKLGFSLQKPAHKSYKKDDQAVAEWKTETLPSLKKS